MVRLFQAGLIAIGARIAAATTTVLATVRHGINPLAAPRRPRKSRPDISEEDLTARQGIDAVEKIFRRDPRWFFRKRCEPDIGVDAQAEILNAGNPTGRFIALQIRFGQAWFKTSDGDYIYHGENKHREYWTKHSLPVCVVIVNPETGLMLWQRVDEQLCQKTGTGWSIVIPATNVLDASAKLSFDEAISSDPESLIRSVFALDHALMEEIQDQTTFFVWDEWLNRNLSFRNLRIYIGEDEEQELVATIDYQLRARSLHEIMTKLFPWAIYSYAEPISEYSGVVAVHILDVELRPAAHAYLEAESFFEAGYPEDDEPLPPEPEDFVTEEEEQEFWRSRRGSRDPHDRED
ncbi:hypothetical protein AC244_24495 [Ensifer adhaerens]|uniref:DUF4365 domain-containing protein n=1 Tax=Ensifer adhaerens TaxID=106592 RepID=A0A0L8BKV9_ENSAD|nr:DUF4365 domain-containing protein [Ensifer adhaerens]KOF15230.1 hypothetical protein AC244_24495 [Ensifer adhaerens]